MLRALFALFIGIHAYGQSSHNTELLDHWSEDTLITSSTLVRYNECWGFVRDGIEYAIAGSTEGTHFFQLTDDNRLNFVDFVEGRFNSAQVIHRDFAIYDHYAYSVCDEGQSSLQIIDLNYLPDSVHVVGDNDTTFARVHNIFIDTTHALLYACIITPKINGSLGAMKSMEVFSLADPLNPTLVYTGPGDVPEVHDVYVRDNIAILSCGFDGLRVYDFTNPASPVFLHNMSIYQDQGYNHQGWLTPNGNTFIFGDETEGKRLKKCSFENNEVQITSYFGTNWLNNSVPHNIMLSNEFAYVAYYNEGLRIYDIRPQIPVEVAHYDTYPIVETLFKMKGAWGIYAKYPSGRILVSDRVYGLFLIDFREDLFLNSLENGVFVHPSPALQGQTIAIQLGSDEQVNSFTVDIYTIGGKHVHHVDVANQSYTELPANLASGVYLARVKYQDYLGDEIRHQRKFVIH